MFIRLWSLLTRRKLVWLLDMDGEVNLSVAYLTPFGDLTAERHWPFKIRRVKLGDGGNVIDGEYVKKWVWYSQKAAARTESTSGAEAK